MEQWSNLTTLDNNPDHHPDILHDLLKIPLPFEANIWDEIHAYEVLEHVGRQGDADFFFLQFSDFHRILKPGGVLFATVPDYRSQWAWGDPSHTRVITQGSLVFLSQAQYEQQIGNTPMSDFRNIYKADFDIIHSVTDGECFQFAIRAIK